MKQVTIVIPKGRVNLSSISGSFEILTRANQYWQRMGNKSHMEICIAGYVRDLQLESGFFSIHPVNIEDIPVTDLIIIPSLSYDYDHVLKDNAPLIKWIREQYKM